MHGEIKLCIITEKKSHIKLKRKQCKIRKIMLHKKMKRMVRFQFCRQYLKVTYEIMEYGCKPIISRYMHMYY